MPEVKIVRHDYRIKEKTIVGMSFVTAEFVEKRFGCTIDAFLSEYGKGRRVSIRGDTMYAVVSSINKVQQQTVVKVLTAPMNAPLFIWGPSLAADARSTRKPDRAVAVIDGGTQLADLLRRGRPRLRRSAAMIDLTTD